MGSAPSASFTAGALSTRPETDSGPYRPQAQRAIRAAAIEAKSGYRGVGIVKLMGRQSGFIATYASIASGEVDICLIPEARPTHSLCPALSLCNALFVTLSW